MIMKKNMKKKLIKLIREELQISPDRLSKTGGKYILNKQLLEKITKLITKAYQFEDWEIQRLKKEIEKLLFRVVVNRYYNS